MTLNKNASVFGCGLLCAVVCLLLLWSMESPQPQGMKVLIGINPLMLVFPMGFFVLAGLMLALLTKDAQFELAYPKAGFFLGTLLLITRAATETGIDNLLTFPQASFPEFFNSLLEGLLFLAIATVLCTLGYWLGLKIRKT